MLDDVLAIPDHLRDALWRVESARLTPIESAGLLVCGMGGSAIGGDLARATLGERLRRPMLTVRGYDLPPWATDEWLVFGCSYSGDTEEAIACFEAAGRLGARRVFAGTGGAMAEAARAAGEPVIGLPGLLPAPRTAVVYVLVCALEVAAAAGAAPRLGEEIEAAATFLEAARDQLRRLAAEIRGTLGDAFPVICGAESTAAVARRWKTQVNENAQLPAFFSELPEADHNEICGWAGDVVDGRLALVTIEDRDQDPRVLRRFELTAAEVERQGSAVVRIETSGESRLERLLWAVMLGDLVSLELAEERGVDPLPVEAIDRIKAALGT